MSRGIQDERSLARLLWERGFAVMRAPASGAATKMARPDLVVGSRDRGLQFAIEVKTTRRDVLYIQGPSIAQLLEFSQRFGCQPIVALKFKGHKQPWLFIHPYQLLTTPGLNYKISLKDALLKGMDFKTLIGEGEQTRLLA
jgi:Holliday junction resolvase